MRGRDRTAEFIATINSKRDKPQYIQKRRQLAANGSGRQLPRVPNRLALDPQYREMMRISQDCSYRIRDSFAKLERFTVLARKRTVFDDGELNRLIDEIRNDISETKSQLDYLQSKCEPKQKHTGNIMSILQRKLANVTSNFKSTLEIRSRTVQQQATRQELYTGPATSASAYRSNAPTVLDMMSVDSAQLVPSSSHSIDPYQGQLFAPQQSQQLLITDQTDLTDRAEAMQLVERTITELGTVFNQLAHIVQDQGETITRIDMNISDTTANVEAAHDALLRYFNSINSNRWLILKTFGVLFFFFILFVVFSS